MNADQEAPNMTDILSESLDLFYLQSYVMTYQIASFQVFQCSYEAMQQVKQ